MMPGMLEIPVDPAQPALEIQDLSKTYGGTPVLKGLSLKVEPGEVFGLLGPNGAGKSTTINLISGVARMETGSVRVFGYDNRSQASLTRRLVGVMHQEIVFDPFFPVGRALKIHSGYYGAKDDPAWRELLIERLALGPHTQKSMNKLSGGMKRRFMVAKALIHKPRLLILDEPTAGVDVELRRALWDFVRTIRDQGTTVLLTTHYLEEAEEMCDRIAILNQGKLVALDRTRNLMARLDRRRLRVHLATPQPNPPATLAPWSPVALEGGSRWEFHISGSDGVGRVLGKLFEMGVPVTDVETRSANLEDVFLELTASEPAPAGRPREESHVR